MKTCKKCGCNFTPTKGLKDYCSLACRNSRSWTEEDRLKKSISARNSEKLRIANSVSTKRRRPKLERIITICLGCNKPIIHTITTQRKYHAKCWIKNSGGLREGSTRKHRSEYKGFIMDSGAEKAFAMRCDELGMEWIKNKTIYFTYIDKKGNIRKYYPDFFLPKYDKWIEVKGKFYESKDENFEIKLQSVPNIVLVYSTGIKLFNIPQPIQ